MQARVVLAALLVLAAALPAAAQGQEPVVYSSLPLQGEYADSARDIVRGIELALERAGAPVRHVSLDDSTPQVGTWTPEAVARNARRAARDGRAIAYIGEFNSGASAISLPILNSEGLLQVSPSNTAIGLTARGPGTDPGEPDKYYPSGERTYGRVVPDDRVQGRAAGVVLRDAGIERLLVLHDGEIYGRGMAMLAAGAARARGIRVVAVRRYRGRNAGRLAAEARLRRADGVYFGGVGFTPAVRLWRALGRVRGLRLFGPDGLAFDDFARRIPAGAARRTQITVSTLAPEAYPEAGQEVLRALGEGTDPYALHGYEAMSVVLDALARGGPTRKGMVDAFFATRDRDSVLGRYSIQPSGDTTLSRYGVYGVRDGRLVWERAVDAAVG
ncbi:MAG TPA: branched-chain amino acid ABC transporter substrate-binding protein [Solirubrobacteraceae bacterium]|nr:branched-chain amino acid ABC transporter substrate-binding protein [Solirubrobacteraceae bacterium]